MFGASSPVTGVGFFGRAAELQEVLAAFDSLQRGSPRWLAVLGPRKVGKTSLVLEASRRAAPFAVAVLDALEVAPVSLELFRSLVLRALDALLADGVGASLARALRDPPL